jgi:hypothetical protein
VKSHTTAGFRKALAALPASVRQQAREAYRLFKQNPQHPGLRFKRVHKTRSIYSARVNLDYRAVGVLDGDAIVWFWIGPHDQYMQLLKRL